MAKKSRAPARKPARGLKVIIGDETPQRIVCSLVPGSMLILNRIGKPQICSIVQVDGSLGEWRPFDPWDNLGQIASDPSE